MVRIPGFKPYNQDQTLLLSISHDEPITTNHSARVICAIVDKLDLSVFYDRYCTTTGQNAYDPRMLIKVIFYAAFKGISSSRVIEKKLHTDAAFMYLAAMQRPTYRTIIRFRKNFSDELEAIFEQIVRICPDLDPAGLDRVAFDDS
ncbi:MAG: transposase, partial [Methanomicrobiales archaeon]|nr:transposase [Methanomicrobiales archaeon]